jgi:hypothetical protein
MKRFRLAFAVMFILSLALPLSASALSGSDRVIVQELVSGFCTDWDNRVEPLAKSGAICRQYGHWWIEEDLSIAQFKKEELSALRRCKLCGEVEVISRGWRKQ